MKKIILSTYLTLLITLLFTSCNNNHNKDNYPRITTNTNNQLDLENPPFDTDENIYYFTISNNEEVYAISEDKALAKYSLTGDLIEEYNIDNLLSNIYFHNEKLYAYDMNENRIIAFDLESKKIEQVTNEFGFEVTEVKNLTVIDNYVYILLAEHDDNMKDYVINDSGYINFNEKLYSINLSNGKLEDLKIDNIIAIYTGFNEELYIYSYKDENYELYSYDMKKHNIKKITDMNDVGYIYAFIYENDNFTYITPNQTINNKSMTDNFVDILVTDIYSGPGSNVRFYNNNLIYLKIPYTLGEFDSSKTYKTEIVSLYLGETDIKESEVENYTKRDEKLNISTDLNLIDTVYLRELTGMSGGIIHPAGKNALSSTYYDREVFLTGIMAGNSDIDIYLLNTGGFISDILRNKGVYVPLNDSSIITSYVNSCFDYIKESAMVDNNGNKDIWMLPLSQEALSLWYVPDNFEEFSLSYSDIEYFDGFINTLKILYNTKGNYSTYGYVTLFESACMTQYEATYNDYPNKKVNFNTELYKNIFETLWGGGWLRYEGVDQNNILFRRGFEDRVSSDNIEPDYNTEKVIFKLEYISEQLSSAGNQIESWRVFPQPKISQDVKENLVGHNFAIVNPYSKNKDAAIAYLEAIAENPHKSIKTPVFVQKDIKSYEGVYNMSLPVYSDIYSIFKDGKIFFGGYPYKHDDYVDEYQHGRIDVDEAVNILQREVEMWINEQ